MHNPHVSAKRQNREFCVGAARRQREILLHACVEQIGDLPEGDVAIAVAVAVLTSLLARLRNHSLKATATHNFQYTDFTIE